MTPIEINIFLFVLAVVGFAIIGFSAMRKQHSTKDYFHEENLAKNVFSLTATNITLGTGLVYLVTGAQHNGLLMLLVPIMTWLGYYLLATFIEKATDISARTGKNFLASLNEQITKATGKPSHFASTISGALVIVYVLVLAFEIFASTKVTAPFLFKEPNLTAEIWLSIIIFVITIIYTITGGITAVFRVDFLQVPLICLMIPIFIITAIPDLNNPASLFERLGTSLKLNSAVLAAVAIASINAISTQFYSILNWGAISHVKLRNQQRLMKCVGAATGIVLAIFVLVGLLHPVEEGGQVWQGITQNYIELASQSTFKAYLFCGILLLGMSSILLTTTDAVVITSIMFWYDNVAGGDSMKDEQNPIELKRIRSIGTVAFTLCFIVLMTINYWQPDPFYLLLSMAGGAAVFAPMIAAAGWLSSHSESMKILNDKVVYGFLILFIVVGITSVVLLILKSTFVGYIGVSGFLLSLIFSIAIVLVAYGKNR